MMDHGACINLRTLKRPIPKFLDLWICYLKGYKTLPSSLSILYLSVIRFPYQNLAYLLNINKARNPRLGNNPFLRHLRQLILVHLLEFKFPLRELIKSYTVLLKTKLI